jgi:two-component system OmpR family sensor kinase
MFTSLRSRLWLSYAVLILLVLCVFAGTVAVSMVNNPLLYRNTVLKMRTEMSVLLQRLENAPEGRVGENFEVILRRASEASGYRFLMLDRANQLLFDTGSGNLADLRKPRLQNSVSEDTFSSGYVRDIENKVWIYTAKKLVTNNWLVALTPRPRLLIINVFRDEILQPMFIAGGIAVIVALLSTIVLTRSITGPLKRLSEATHVLATDQYPHIIPEGPAEVRQLAISFNNMNDRVRSNQQSQRDFIANVSHELKTPLTAIQGFAQALVDGTVVQPEEVNQAANVIHQEAGRLHRLVLDLLALTRLESGTADLQHEPVNLKHILQTILEKFRLQAEKNDIDLTAEIKALPVVNGDGDRLAQVFTNLVDNALKFTPKGGVIKLSACYERGSVFIRVKDNGVGISAEDQKRIFERFYQVDKSRKGGTGRGIGLGLAIARQIVLAHQGEISLESAPNQGTTFIVSLPVEPDLSIELDNR